MALGAIVHHMIFLGVKRVKAGNCGSVHCSLTNEARKQGQKEAEMKFGQATVTLKKQAGSAEPTHKMSNNQRAIDPIPVWSKHSYCDCTDIKNVQP